ncbi:hypothetical protein GOP47_0019486 [Adiantum capillus-veneris]|uniref:Uncharacterized protein n=1 Tax=Adiantum capillus-veneris TaxID=13818 RepID=A0A9D4UB55_ADICA|nr:hypothetical protein GOP47_0019486 [Adiantum capillus-veneris]
MEPPWPPQNLNVLNATDEGADESGAKSHVHHSLSSLFVSQEGDAAAVEASASEVCSHIDELQALLQMHVLRGNPEDVSMSGDPKVVSMSGEAQMIAAYVKELQKDVVEASFGQGGGQVLCMYSQKEILFLEAALHPIKEDEASRSQLAINK